MPKRADKSADLQACVVEFDRYLEDRIEQFSQTRANSSNTEHRTLLKTERAEAEHIQFVFQRMFALWLLDDGQISTMRGGLWWRWRRWRRFLRGQTR